MDWPRLNALLGHVEKLKRADLTMNRFTSPRYNVVTHLCLNILN